MNDEAVFDDLKSAVYRLTDLPKFLASHSKNDRKHGQIILRDILLPKFSELIRHFDQYGCPDLADPRDNWPKYLTYLKNGEYVKAMKFAGDWYRNL